MSGGASIQPTKQQARLLLQCQFSCQFKDIDTKHDLTSAVAPLSPQPSLPDQKPVSSPLFINFDRNLDFYFSYFTPC